MNATTRKLAAGPSLGHAIPLYAEPADRAEWVAARQAAGTVGASEVYRILFGDALLYAMEQRGLSERPNLDDVAIVQRGNDAEPFILAWAGATKPGWVYRHPEHACMTCTPDGVTPEGVVAEAKFTHAWNRETVLRFINHGPMAVLGTFAAKWWVQCQVQVAITGLPVELAVMVGTESLADCWAGRRPVEGDMYRIPVEPDPDFIAKVEREVPAFHTRFLVGDELPDPGPTDEDLRAAMADRSERWLVEAGVVVDRPDLEALVGRFVLDSEDRKAAQSKEDAAKRAIKAALIASKAEVVRVGVWEVRTDTRGALKLTERRDR